MNTATAPADNTEVLQAISDLAHGLNDLALNQKNLAIDVRALDVKMDGIQADIKSDMGLMQADIKGLGHRVKTMTGVTLVAVFGVAIALVFYLFNAAAGQKIQAEIQVTQPVVEIIQPVADTTQPDPKSPNQQDN